MILEGEMELRIVRKCKELKEKEEYCYSELEKAIEECDDAWKNGNDQDVKAAWDKADNKKKAWETAKGELQEEANGIIFLALNALKEGRHIEKTEISLCCYEKGGEINAICR